MPGGLLLLKAGAAAGGGGTPPPITATPVSAGTNAAGSQFSIVFSNPVTGFSSGSEGFDLVGDGVFNYVIAYLSGNGTGTITFSISFATIPAGVVLDTDYVPGDITAVGGAAVSGFADFPVTNNVPPTVVEPGFRSFAALALGGARTVTV